jgi:hypothetical protein
VEKTINQMDEISANDESQTSDEILTELSVSIKLTIPFKAEAKTLAKQLAPATNKTIPALTPQVLSLQDRI